ncbi:MAG: hypothetical protein ABIN89_19390 [Chitinophagaceae bacterium]
MTSLLNDINALTPQTHRASDFQQLYQALLQRLDVDSRIHKQTLTKDLLKKLSLGSQQYYNELTGINGPYHHLDITREILAGIHPMETLPGATEAMLHNTVRNRKDEELLLENTPQEL